MPEGGPGIPAESGAKPRARQWYEILRLALARGFTPEEYHNFRLSQKGRDYREARSYLSHSELLDVVIPSVNQSSWMPILENKWLFYLYFRNFDVPTSLVHGLYNSKGGMLTCGRPFCTPSHVREFVRARRPDRLVLKSATGWKGQDLFIVKHFSYEDGGPMVTLESGSRLGLDALIREIESTCPSRAPSGFVVEDMLEQHSFFQELNPDTLNDIRVVTFLDGQNQPQIHQCVVRVGRKGGGTANLAQGGIGIVVDPTTGTLGVGGQLRKFGEKAIERHPDSQIEFCGRKVPMWPRVVEVSKRMARLTPGLRIVGWDVVLTDSGPVVLEGNPIFGVGVHQKFGRGYLQPAVRVQFEGYGLEFPQERLPLLDAGLFRACLRRWTRHLSRNWRAKWR